MPTVQSLYRRNRSRGIRLFSAFVFLASLSVVPPLHAQPTGDINRLYIPPILTVTAADGMEVYQALTRGRAIEREEVDAGNRIAIRATRYAGSEALLPMIFFDQGSSAIPGGYEQFSGRNRAADYNENRMIDVSFEAEAEERSKYREILNIIGFRMDRYRDIRIELQGGYTTEAGENAAVGYDRAVMVRHYLHDIWDIDTSRVRLLPPEQRAGSDENAMVLEEGRRVDILCDDHRLTDDVSFMQQLIDYRPIALFITLDPRMQISEVAGMMITIVTDGQVLSHTSIPVSSDSSIYHLITLWALPRMPQKLDAPLIVQATVQNWSGEMRESNPVSLSLDITGMTGEDDELSDTAYEYDYENNPHPRPDDEIYEYEQVSFYAAGDSLIRPWQRPQLDSILNVLRTIMLDHPQPYTISLSASVDIGEIPEINPAEVSGLLGMKRMERFTIGRMLRDPSLEVPLYILPKLDPSESMKREDRQRIEEDIVRTLFGPYYDRISEAQDHDEDSDGGISVTDDMMPGITRIQLARCRELERELRRVLPAEMIDTIIIDSNQMRSYWLSLNASPKGRFFARETEIRLESGEYQPEPPYEEEDYEYDEEGYEYEENGEEGVEYDDGGETEEYQEKREEEEHDTTHPIEEAETP